MTEKMRRAPRTRTFLAAIKSKLARKGVRTDELIAALKREHPEIVRMELQDLADIGLVKLANETFALHSVAGKNSTQLEMFAEYGTGPDVILRVIDKKGRVTKVCRATDSLGLGEADRHIAEQMKPRPRKPSKEVTELARLVNDVRKFGESDASTIGESWRAKQASNKK
jgi:ribosomal protein L7/L12